METLIDSLSHADQKDLDPTLFTSCPSCQHHFKIPDETITIDRWFLRKDDTRYDDVRVKITAAQSLILYELSKSKHPIASERLGYRVCGRNTEDYANVLAVQISRLRKILKKLNIPSPIRSKHGVGYYWDRG